MEIDFEVAFEVADRDNRGGMLNGDRIFNDGRGIDI